MFAVDCRLEGFYCMDFAERLNEVLAEHFPEESAPGGALMLWRRGEDVVFGARGLANLDTGEGITPETCFRLASVAKQFTAACVLQLAEEGRLNLAQPLTDILSGFPGYGQAITVEHLLRHTSGLRDYEKLLSAEQADAVRDRDVVKMLCAQEGTDFAAGERFRYSNSGYAVLAVIVEEVSGLDFPAYLRERIFNRAGMTDAVAFVDEPGMRQPRNRAIGYALGDDGHYRWADQNVTTAVLGDGGIYCSAVDYGRWIEGYLSGSVIGADLVERAFLPGRTSGGDVVPYGYGWRLELAGAQETGVWRPYHPGSTSGFRNGVVLDPGGNWAVLALTNRCNGDGVAMAREVVWHLCDI